MKTANFLGKFEKHLVILSITLLSTNTKTLFIGLFINTSIIVLLVNANFYQWTNDNVSSYLFSGEYEDLNGAWYVNVGLTLTLTMIGNTMNPHLKSILLIPYKK